MLHQSQLNARGSLTFETKWNWIICWVHVCALEGGGGWASFPSKMYACIMTPMAFVRKEVLFFSASEVSVQGPWKIISSPRQAKLSAILTGFEKEYMCVCVYVHICALTAVLWSPPPPPFFLTTHTSPLHRFSAVWPITPFLLSVAFTCVTLRVLPWWSLMLSPHTMSPPVSGWGWIVVDDADRLRTSSLPLGIGPIFTGGHIQ